MASCIVNAKENPAEAEMAKGIFEKEA